MLKELNAELRVQLNTYSTYREALEAAKSVAAASGYAIDIRQLDTGRWEIEGPGSIAATEDSFGGKAVNQDESQARDFDDLIADKERVEEGMGYQDDYERNNESGWPYEN